MSEISKIYAQYHQSLTSSQSEYEERLKTYAGMLKHHYDKYMKKAVYNFSKLFGNQVGRLEMKAIAERFFGVTDIPFVAIDGSCHKHQAASFISFYGGAYGSKGTVSLRGPEGKLRYQRWELSRDVSMVAFVPIPPDTLHSAIDVEEEAGDAPKALTDSEIAEVSSLHTKIMQLAEVYLAYSLAKSSSLDAPRLILIDNSIGGILANSSFSPSTVRLTRGDFDGESLTAADLHIALAHPFNQELNVPSTKNFQPHFRVISEAVWRETRTMRAKDCAGFPVKNFGAGARFLAKKIGAGKYDEAREQFSFSQDPRVSWRKTLRIFEDVCEKLFRQKDPMGITYALRDRPGRREFLMPRDILFLVGVGIRALIETCWKRKILLVGVVKDSASRFFYRNYLGSVYLLGREDPSKHLAIPLTDRSIIELLPSLDGSLQAPWGTLEFDACFMTLHPEKLEDGDGWTIKGYDHPRLGETTRPEKIFLRSIAQFLLSPDGNLASHALFVDRLTYPGWDDKDSGRLSIDTKFFGSIDPLYYDAAAGPPRLQRLVMYLLTVLVRNHFPEALGYPDPLHQADWGAKSMKRRILGLLDSSEWAFRSRPLSKTRREIRDGFR